MSPPISILVSPWLGICFVVVLSFTVIGCGERTTLTDATAQPQTLSQEIDVNGTRFPTQNIAKIVTTGSAQITVDTTDPSFTYHVVQKNGVVDLIQNNGEIVRISPDGSFLNIPPEKTP